LRQALSGISLAGKLNLRWWLSFLETTIARDQLMMGNMDQCWVYIHAVIEREKEIDDKTILKSINTVLGNLYRTFGDLEEAARVFRLGIDETVQDVQTLENTYLLGLTLARSHSPKTGAEVVSRVKVSARERGLGMIAINAQITEFMMLGPDQVHVDGQKRTLELILEDIERRGLGTSRIALDIVKGTLAQKEEKALEAEEYFKRVLEYGIEHSHIWIELLGYQYLLGLYVPGSKEHAEYRRKAREVRERLRERCTLPPLRRLYNAYRKNMEL